MEEILGWIATLIIIVSFIQKDIFKLRLYSLFGAIFWIIYGFLLESYSIIFLNFIICIIQTYWLLKLYKKTSKSKKDS